MNEGKWDLIIDGHDRQGRSSLKKIWKYRDLLGLLVRRDFVAFYKQTVLGPVWFFIKPVFTAATYFFIFGKIAGLSTDGIPPVLFYLSGIMLWSFFTETVVKCEGVLRENADIFGKVYFPRLIMPMSIIFSSIFRLSVQLILLFLIFLYYLLITGTMSLSFTIFLIPLIIIIVAFQALGLGLFVASVAVKYRDISMLLGYMLQLGLFVAPVVFPLSSLTGNFKLLVLANPMSLPVELFRYAFFGTGNFSVLELFYTILATLIMLTVGIYAFNKTEKIFVDTV
jgi:lipopolysaccharide transport system permease protein